MQIVILQILALLGAVNAVYLWRKRLSPKPMICPLKQDCRALYDLPQAQFFGIHWDIWGMLYYLGMFVIISTSTSIPFAMILLKLGAGMGVVVSAYLLYIQYSVKNYCTWCLLSELISILIAIIIFTA